MRHLTFSQRLSREHVESAVVGRVQEYAREARNDVVEATLQNMLAELTADATARGVTVMPQVHIDMEWLMPNPDYDPEDGMSGPMISVDRDEDWTMIELRITAGAS